MSTDTPRVPDVNPASSPPTLTDRVKARVAAARSILDDRAREADPKPGKHRPATKSSAALTDSSETDREVESLRRVYCEMRTLYRGYRRKTGTPPVPELRSAVRAFRHGQSLTSLVHIASFLDDRKLLAW